MKRKYYVILLATFSAGLLVAPVGQAQMFGNNLSPETTQKIRVEKVLSADTFRLENGQKVRMIGLKAPALPKRDVTGHDEYGFVVEKVTLTKTIEERALAFVRQLLEGQYVRMEFDVDKKDPSSYTLAYVFLSEDNAFANTEILRQGYANLSLTPPNLKYQDALRAAYREAREEHRGLHEDY